MAKTRLREKIVMSNDLNKPDARKVPLEMRKGWGEKGQMIDANGDTKCKKCGRKLKNHNCKNVYLAYGYGPVCGARMGLDPATGKFSHERFMKMVSWQRSFLPTKGDRNRMSYVPRHNSAAVGWCYVTEIADEDGILHVLFTEPNRNSGMSITNATEDVATQYVDQFLGAENFDKSRLLFYECYENGGLAEGGVDRIEYEWKAVSEGEIKYGLPWWGYPRGLKLIAYRPRWWAGTGEDEARFGLPPRPACRIR